MPKPGRRRSDQQVARRRAHVWAWFTGGRWTPADRLILQRRWGVGERQLYHDVEHMRAEQSKRVDPTQREKTRELLIAQCELVKRTATAAIACGFCRGAGVSATCPVCRGVDPDNPCTACDGQGRLPEEILCVDCGGAGTSPKADPAWGRVMLQAIEVARKLAGIEGPEQQVTVTVEHANPVQLLGVLQEQLDDLAATGAGALPIIDAEAVEVIEP